MQSTDPVQNAWLKFLNPNTLRENLVRASMFLAAFEILENSVIDGLRGFICFEYDDDNRLIDSEHYKDKVLARHRSRFAASFDWLIENGAVEINDRDCAQRIREHRNLIGHELPKIIASSDHELEDSLFDELYNLVAKIDRYWIRELEIPSNSDFDQIDPYEIPDSEITSGNMIFLGLMRDIAIGETGDAMYNAVVEALRKAQENETSNYKAMNRSTQSGGNWNQRLSFVPGYGRRYAANRRKGT